MTTDQQLRLECARLCGPSLEMVQKLYRFVSEQAADVDGSIAKQLQRSMELNARIKNGMLDLCKRHPELQTEIRALLELA